jgi:hypothetical protein
MVEWLNLHLLYGFHQRDFQLCFAFQINVVLFFLNPQFSILDPFLIFDFCSSSILDSWYSILSCTLHDIFTRVTLIVLSPHPSDLTFISTTFRDNLFQVLSCFIGLPKCHNYYRLCFVPCKPLFYPRHS